MGFFSRLFKIKEQDPDSQETTWAMEDNGSELVLDAEYATTLMTEIDIDAAIASHESWRLQLQDMVNGRSTEVMRPERICQDDRCDLGRWLHGTGKVLPPTGFFRICRGPMRATVGTPIRVEGRAGAAGRQAVAREAQDAVAAMLGRR